MLMGGGIYKCKPGPNQWKVVCGHEGCSNILWIEGPETIGKAMQEAEEEGWIVNPYFSCKECREDS